MHAGIIVVRQNQIHCTMHNAPLPHTTHTQHTLFTPLNPPYPTQHTLNTPLLLHSTLPYPTQHTYSDMKGDSLHSLLHKEGHEFPFTAMTKYLNQIAQVSTPLSVLWRTIHVQFFCSYAWTQHIYNVHVHTCICTCIAP